MIDLLDLVAQSIDELAGIPRLLLETSLEIGICR